MPIKTNIMPYHYFVNIFYSIIFRKILAPMSQNVPAVYDVLAARISKHVVFAGLAKCGWSVAWEWSAAE
jgi:hypothetical protein